MSLFATFEGKWFLPEKEDNCITGKLTITEDSDIKLELNGLLFDEKSPEFKEAKCILGRTSQGEFITLIDCTQIGVQHTSFASKSTFFCYTFIKGEFCKDDLPKFKKAYIRSNFLNEFLDKRIFQSSLKNQEERSIEITTFEKEIFEHPDFKILLRTYPSCSFSSNLYELKRNSNIIINFTDDVKEEIFTKNSEHLIKFFSILSNKKLSAQGINFYTTDPYSELLFLSLRNRFLNSTIDSKEKYLLQFGEIEDDIANILTQWYSNIDKNNILSILLIDSFTDSEGFLEDKFLSLCKFLELFHKMYRNSEINQNKNKLFEEAIEDCRVSNKKALEAILKEKIHPSFKERLDKLFEEAEPLPLLKIYLPSKSDSIRRISKSRNQYTHYHEDSSELILKGQDLLHYTKSLRVLCTFLLLKEVGVPEIKLYKFISGRKYIFN